MLGTVGYLSPGAGRRVCPPTPAATCTRSASSSPSCSPANGRRAASREPATELERIIARARAADPSARVTSSRPSCATSCARSTVAASGGGAGPTRARADPAATRRRAATAVAVTVDADADAADADAVDADATQRHRARHGRRGDGRAPGRDRAGAASPRRRARPPSPDGQTPPVPTSQDDLPEGGEGRQAGQAPEAAEAASAAPQGAEVGPAARRRPLGPPPPPSANAPGRPGTGRSSSPRRSSSSSGGVVAYAKLTEHAPSGHGARRRRPRRVLRRRHPQERRLRGRLAWLPTARVPGGTILDQDPGNGQKLEQGSTVRLTVSRTDADRARRRHHGRRGAPRSRCAKRGLPQRHGHPRLPGRRRRRHGDEHQPRRHTCRPTKSAAIELVVAADPHVKVPDVVGVDQAHRNQRSCRTIGLEVAVQTASSKTRPAGRC